MSRQRELCPPKGGEPNNKKNSESQTNKMRSLLDKANLLDLPREVVHNITDFLVSCCNLSHTCVRLWNSLRFRFVVIRPFQDFPLTFNNKTGAFNNKTPDPVPLFLKVVGEDTELDIKRATVEFVTETVNYQPLFQLFHSVEQLTIVCTDLNKHPLSETSQLLQPLAWITLSYWSKFGVWLELNLPLHLANTT